MSEEQSWDVEIRGLYDGTAYKYYPAKKEFVWRQHIIDKTTDRYRKKEEERFLEWLKSEQQ